MLVPGTSSITKSWHFDRLENFSEYLLERKHCVTEATNNFNCGTSAVPFESMLNLKVNLFLKFSTSTKAKSAATIYNVICLPIQQIVYFKRRGCNEIIDAVSPRNQFHSI